MQWAKLTASCLGIGYIKGGGSIAAAVTAAACWLVSTISTSNYSFLLLCVAVFITIIGIYCSNQVEKDWGEDSSKVVIDEAAGMAITMLFIPPSATAYAIGWFLFRFFDIVKPLGIKNCEQLPRGYGVMADDVLSGIYANVLLQVVIRIVF